MDWMRPKNQTRIRFSMSEWILLILSTENMYATPPKFAFRLVFEQLKMGHVNFTFHPNFQAKLSLLSILTVRHLSF